MKHFANCFPKQKKNIKTRQITEVNETTREKKYQVNRVDCLGSTSSFSIGSVTLYQEIQCKIIEEILPES